MQGMYVHTHWAYRHPYAARTWTVEDWMGYLQALRSIGYDRVMFWPLTDAMPVQLTASDRAFLANIQRVIRRAHEELGMKFYITAGANVIGNDHASRYRHEARPYFLCEWKVNPKDKQQVQRFMEGRKQQLAPLAEADALVVIDSDPGGYIGSTDDEFVQLAAAQTEWMRQINPNLEFIYWMWFGWEAYNRFWEESQKPEKERQEVEWGGYDRILEMIAAEIPEPWSVLVTWDKHLQATGTDVLRSKRMYNPYGLIEGEPTFPLTNVHSGDILRGLERYRSAPAEFPRGVMANSQTHCLQLPNTYYFAHFAQGGDETSADLERFARQILPDCGEVIAAAWNTIPTGSPERMRVAANIVRSQVGLPHQPGPLKGFLFGDPDRFLVDLVWNLQVRAALLEFAQSFDHAGNNDRKESVSRLLTWLLPYQQRLGFVDACGGLDTILSRVAVIEDTAVQSAVKDFAEWRNLPRRHGCVRRLLYALQRFCEK